MGPAVNLLAWNVRGSTVQISGGMLSGGMRTFACDVAILQESKLEVVSRPLAISLWGRRPIEWLYLPSVGRSGGIIVIWDPQVWELDDSRIGSFSVCSRFKSLESNFEWGLIEVYGPNDDYMRRALFEELSFFMSA